MTTLSNAPTPREFAQAWTRGFAQTLREAAGDDTLSRSEARTIQDRTDGLERYADNAANYFRSTGRESAPVDRVIASGHRYAQTEGAKVAGRGNRISLIEARRLPEDLRSDFFAIRGHQTGAPSMTGAMLESALEAAATLPNGEVLEYWSESEFPVLPVRANLEGSAAIDGATVLKAFGELLEDGIFEDVDVDDLASETLSKAESRAYLKDLRAPYEGDDERAGVMQAGFNRVGALLADQLTDFRLIKIGPKADDGSLAVDQGLYAYFAVGRTTDDQIVGVHYGAVET